MSGKVTARRDGAIGWIVFDNEARRNAVSLAMWEEALAALDGFAADDTVRVVVLRGAGDKAFVSGADISRFEDERAEAAAVARYSETTEQLYERLAGASKPTIAMIRGYCIGGGTGLAVCCDLRICADDARFGIPAARLGLGYGFTRVRRLVELVGPAFAKEIFFTARQFSAAEAAAMGLVNRVVPAAELEAFVRDYAERIAGNAPLTVGSIKEIVAEVLKDPEARDLGRCQQLVDGCFASADYVEGRRAFMEKRKPAFAGR